MLPETKEYIDLVTSTISHPIVHVMYFQQQE